MCVFIYGSLLGEQSPSQTHKAVQLSESFLQEHLFAHSFLHLQDTNSLQVVDASGRAVQLGSNVLSSVSIQYPTPHGRGRQLRIWNQYLTPHVTSLVQCPLDVLLQSCPRW